MSTSVKCGKAAAAVTALSEAVVCPTDNVEDAVVAPTCMYREAIP